VYMTTDELVVSWLDDLMVELGCMDDKFNLAGVDVLLDDKCQQSYIDKGGEKMTLKADASRWLISSSEFNLTNVSVGGYLITSGTQYKEKCEQCDTYSPCCVAECDLFNWKEDESCRFCRLDGVCYGVMDRKYNRIEFDTGDVEQLDKPVIKHKGESYTLSDITKMDDSVDKFVMYFKYVNVAYRYYECEYLCLKTKKYDDRVVVSFQEKLYSFPKWFTKGEILVIVYRDVDSYRVSREDQVG